MIVTYPSMGSLEVLVEAAMRELQILTVPPPPIPSQVLQRVQKYVPEDVCFPMKKILAGLIVAAEAGADTAILPGGHGPCRFGWFATAMQDVLQEMQIPMKILVIEVAGQPGKLLKRLRSAGEIHRMIRMVPDALRAARAIDRLEERMLLYQAAGQRVDVKIPGLYKAESLRQLWETAEMILEKEYAGEVTPRSSLRIGIAGDIYTINDPVSNMHLQSYLAERGILTMRSITLSRYLDQNLEGLFRQRPWDWKQEANRYMRSAIGGYADHTVGYAALWEKEKADGMIQLYPMGCMPEIVIKPLLNTIELPVLSLAMDSLEWNGGYETRLEAFVDMLERRKEAVS